MVITNFQCVTLRGAEVQDSIDADHLRKFSPRWGFNREPQVLAIVHDDIDTLTMVNAKIINELPYIVQAEGIPQKELVLLVEYKPGVGAKRWPGFCVSNDSDTTVLSRCETDKGSGWEKHTLLVAPLGWARNIASQFVDTRDIGDQEITYNNNVDDDMFTTALGAALHRS